MNDPVVSQYLPTLDPAEHKFPERDFFFGVLSTLKNDYLKKIIADAHEVRLKGEEGEEEKHNIVVKDSWLEEL
jgi:hypothetical protein